LQRWWAWVIKNRHIGGHDVCKGRLRLQIRPLPGYKEIPWYSGYEAHRFATSYWFVEVIWNIFYWRSMQCLIPCLISSFQPRNQIKYKISRWPVTMDCIGSIFKGRIVAVDPSSVTEPGVLPLAMDLYVYLMQFLRPGQVWFFCPPLAWCPLCFIRSLRQVLYRHRFWSTAFVWCLSAISTSPLFPLCLDNTTLYTLSTVFLLTYE